MKCSRSIFTGLIGLAMLAAPITAAAKDNDSGRNNSHQERVETRQAPSHNAAPATHNENHEQRSARVETRTEAPAVHNDFRANRNEAPAARNFNQGRVVAAPAPEPRRDVREDRRAANGDWRNGVEHDNDGWKRDKRYRDYDHDDYDHDRDYAAGGWVMPRGYYGGACGWAQHLRNVYRHDEYTGHPAAARDLLWQIRRAERECGGIPYGYNVYR
jgi:hypothetical protein